MAGDRKFQVVTGHRDSCHEKISVLWTVARDREINQSDIGQCILGHLYPSRLRSIADDLNARLLKKERPQKKSMFFFLTRPYLGVRV